MKMTPHIVRTYLLLAAFLLALPTIGTKFYHGQTGKFLVASENIRYEPFRESVIYISRHNLFGAFGLVINKPIDMKKLREVYPDLPENVGDLRLGGPVGLYDQATAIYANHPQEPEVDRDRDRELSLEELMKLVERYPHKKVFIGYSGWGPLQLEMEIIRGTWTVVDAPPDIIFEDNNTFDLWRKLRSIRKNDLYEDQKI